MNRHPDLPPNPRDAKRQRVPVLWSAFPLTIFLIAISIIVAAVSQLGQDQDKVGFLFMGTPVSEARWDEIAAEVAADPPRDDSGAILQTTEQMREAVEQRLHRDRFAEIRQGQVWRLLTPIFLHFGAMHLLFNMMWLWELGRVLESTFRGLRYGLLVAGIAIASNLTQAFVSGINFGGMSGVVYGLFGFVVIRSRYHPAGGFVLNPQTVRYMLIWLVVCFTGMVGPIANGAHVAGLLTGGVIGTIHVLRGGAWGLMQRRRRFHRALAGSDDALHRCAVCGQTERHDPALDFRISTDGEEYCLPHLPPPK